jgi:hypothetical protein
VSHIIATRLYFFFRSPCSIWMVRTHCEIGWTARQLSSLQSKVQQTQCQARNQSALLDPVCGDRLYEHHGGICHRQTRVRSTIKPFRSCIIYCGQSARGRLFNHPRSWMLLRRRYS